MPSPAEKSRVVHFGLFEVDLQEQELRKNGIRIKLQEQPFQILTLLLEHPGQTVTREELGQKLWPTDTFVDFDHSLNSSVKKSTPDSSRRCTGGDIGLLPLRDGLSEPNRHQRLQRYVTGWRMRW